MVHFSAQLLGLRGGAQGIVPRPSKLIAININTDLSYLQCYITNALLAVRHNVKISERDWRR